MSKASERAEFAARLARELPNMGPHQVAEFARLMCRHGATLQRLAEAQCNGDWPADHGDAWKTAPCPRCESGWHPSVLKGKDKICPDCRTADRVRAICTPYGIVPHFGGDPRGAVLVLQVPSGAYTDWGRTGIVVPA